MWWKYMGIRIEEGYGSPPPPPKKKKKQTNKIDKHCFHWIDFIRLYVKASAPQLAKRCDNYAIQETWRRDLTWNERMERN